MKTIVSISLVRPPVDELRAAVSFGIAQGWISKPVRGLSTEAFLKREVRARYHARGLNSNGRKRLKQQFPQLAHLKGREWQREYMRLKRGSVRRYRVKEITT